MDLMIDIEGLATGPETCILTIAAQGFDPFDTGYYTEKNFYARIDLDSQPNRTIEQGTIEWWATQGESQKEAFAEDNRIPLQDALEGLSKLIWKSKHIWAQGPTYDMTILEHAYKSYSMLIPWQYFSVRDSRTLCSLVPSLEKPAASHHALEDCRRQILLVQKALKQLKVSSML